jgi:hypothetical protein
VRSRRRELGPARRASRNALRQEYCNSGSEPLHRLLQAIQQGGSKDEPFAGREVDDVLARKVDQTSASTGNCVG